jgi:hypothetical protein
MHGPRPVHRRPQSIWVLALAESMEKASATYSAEHMHLLENHRRPLVRIRIFTSRANHLRAQAVSLSLVVNLPIGAIVRSSQRAMRPHFIGEATHSYPLSADS